MITQTFGDILFTPGSEGLREFPSPESLKKRIIISTKPPKEYLEAKDIKEKEGDSQRGKAASDEEARRKEIPDLKRHFQTDEKVHGDVISTSRKLEIYILLPYLYSSCRMNWMKIITMMKMLLTEIISHSKL